MNAILHLLIHLLIVLLPLCRTAGARSIVAKNLLLKQHLLVLDRYRRQARNLRSSERIVFGALSTFLLPRGICRAAIVVGCGR